MEGGGDTKREEGGVEDVAQGVQNLCAAVDVDPTEEKLNAILSNNLICEHIVSHLSLGDMKAASEASRNFHRMIRGSLRFQEKAVLLVRKETVELGHLLVDTEQPWRGVKIDVSLPIEVVGTTSHILETAECVSLMAVREGVKIVDGDLVKFLLRVLSATPALTHLQVDLRFLEKILYDVFSCPKVQANLRNLRRLDILEWDYERGAFKSNNGPSYFVDSTVWRDDEESDEDGPFARNFLQLAHLPLRLESFRMNKVSTVGGERNGFMKFIPAILRANAETLEELSVHLNVWGVEDLRAVRLPALKSLTVTINPEDQETLAVFLTNHPLLEELEVGVREQFGRSLFAAIEGRCGKLRKLHLKTKMFGGFVGAVDWSFLGGMKRLKDFKISRPHDPETDFECYGTGPRFLAALPKGQLERLSFKGISEFGFWRGGGEGEAELGWRKELLGGFVGVRRLSLVRCHDAVDDALMQFILTEFRALEELEVSHCDNLTDAGLSGEGVEGGVSIRNLKGLKVLSIRACPSVTPEGLLSCVKLPFLKSFDYLTKVAVPESFVLKLAEQNGSLETIGVHLSPLEAPLEGRTKAQLKAKNGRLSKLTNLNDGEWIDEDSDSDAEAVDYAFGDGDSDISGGGYDRHACFDVLDEYADVEDEYDDDYEDDDDFM